MCSRVGDAVRRRVWRAALAAGAAGLLATAANPAASEAGSAAGSVWEAADRLDPHPDAPGPSGARLWTGATTYEAAPELWSSRLAAGYEPDTGPGARLAWRRFWLPEGEAADRLDAALALRGPGFRLAATVEMERLGHDRAARVAARGDRLWAPGVLGGLRVEMDPAASDGGAQVSVGVVAVRGPWLAALELGDGTGLRRLATGLHLAPSLVWTVSVSGTDPTTGLAVRLWKGELRIRETRHALLGSVTTVDWVLGGRLR